MKIASSTMEFKASHTFSQSTTVTESSRFWLSNTRQNSSQPEPPPPRVQLSEAGKHAAAKDNLATENCRKTGHSDERRNQDPEMAIICDIIEKITGKAVKIFDPAALQVSDSAEDTAALANPAGNSHTSNSSAPSQSSSGFGYEYQQHQTYREHEETSFAASGVITTSDGKTINFGLSLNMSRDYTEESNTQVRLGDAAKTTDPLIINFSGTAAQLSDKRFNFDLNSDGASESLAQLSSGSGFLALDRNQDGKINDGRELFGPNSGDGFADLAALDDDHNGWIDENDSAFKSLSVWQPSSETSAAHSLRPLNEYGIGAIALQAIQTPFSIKNSSNELLGQIRSSSVFLRENGETGSIQQLDLVA